MEWDLGLQGLGLLMVMSLGSGAIAQLVVGRATTRWHPGRPRHVVRDTKEPASPTRVALKRSAVVGR